MRKEAVIIGAGQTGRGFIAPILLKNDYHITFIDKDENVIRQLCKEKEYTINYFGGVKPSIKINDFDAFAITDTRAIERLANADLITTSVYANNIKDLVTPLKEAASRNKRTFPLQVICCENGVHVKQPLLEEEVPCSISEGIIFCTTLQDDKKNLDLRCQDYPNIPVDANVKVFHIEIDGMPLEKDFPSLIQRKIYTYNFISALVAYLGDYLGYEIYSDAANDVQIAQIIEEIKPLISRIIAKDFCISYEEQYIFTSQAIDKFKNKEIADTIQRNSVQAFRKLGEHERIMTPLRLAYEQQEDLHLFCFICAATCRYGVQKESMQLDPILQMIRELCNDEVANYIKNLTYLFIEQKPFQDIKTYTQL